MNLHSLLSSLRGAYMNAHVCHYVSSVLGEGASHHWRRGVVMH